MWNNHSIPSTCDQGRDPGDRPDCILCEEYISSKAATVTHRVCGKTFDRACISKLIQARGVNAKCPSCKLPLSWESTLEEVKRWTPELEAEWEAEFEVKVHATLTEATSADAAWLIERLRAERGEEWIAVRTNLSRDLKAAFEERRGDRFERLAEAVEDEEEREERRRKRDAMAVVELAEIFEAFAAE